MNEIATNYKVGLDVGHSLENFLIKRKFLTVDVDFERSWLYEMVRWGGHNI